MKFERPLFDRPQHIFSERGDSVWVSALDKRTARKNAAHLVKIHNLIPFVHWTIHDILSDKIDGRVFAYKWDLSLLITTSEGQPIGFLISYLRHTDTNFTKVSVYMHRMALLAPLQRRGIGRRVISLYLAKVFGSLALDFVTLQTNDNVANIRIIQLYEDLGFRKIKRVFYPDKTDWLMARHRHFDPRLPSYSTK